MQLFIRPTAIERPDIRGLLPDNWLATSALQKAIRRGSTSKALLATAYLLNKQPERFWRRIVVVALEDIGIGDLQLVDEALSISGKTKWREENGGDWLIASNLVNRLCAAPKCRNACEALVIADLMPGLSMHRNDMVDWSTANLCACLSDDSTEFGQRILAAWYLAGTKRFPALNLPTREGSFGELLDVYASMGVPPHVNRVAQLGSTRTMEGHALSLPLIWLLAAQAGDHELLVGRLTPSTDIAGWPEYAFDMHTRAGKKAIKLFLQRCVPISAIADRYVPASQQELFVGTLVFRLEGENVAPRLSYTGSNSIIRGAQAAHLTHQGLPIELVSDVLTHAYEHSDLLHQCRLDAVRGYRR